MAIVGSGRQGWGGWRWPLLVLQHKSDDRRRIWCRWPLTRKRAPAHEMLLGCGSIAQLPRPGCWLLW
jgi:hypothetical protein